MLVKHNPAPSRGESCDRDARLPIGPQACRCLYVYTLQRAFSDIWSRSPMVWTRVLARVEPPDLSPCSQICPLEGDCQQSFAEVEAHGSPKHAAKEVSVVLRLAPVLACMHACALRSLSVWAWVGVLNCACAASSPHGGCSMLDWVCPACGAGRSPHSCAHQPYPFLCITLPCQKVDMYTSSGRQMPRPTTMCALVLREQCRREQERAASARAALKRQREQLAQLPVIIMMMTGSLLCIEGLLCIEVFDQWPRCRGGGACMPAAGACLCAWFMCATDSPGFSVNWVMRC